MLDGTTVVARFEYVIIAPDNYAIDVDKINGTTVLGAGTSGDLWRGS